MDEVAGGVAMCLAGFRVTNFRSVVDSGWFGAVSVNALVEINESGKSNLLPLWWKLNPAEDAEIQSTSDYRETQYASIKDAPGSSVFFEAGFKLDDKTRVAAANMAARLDAFDEPCLERRTQLFGDLAGT